MQTTFQCERFANTTIIATVRSINRGDLAGAYRAIVKTVERSAWSKACCCSFKSAGAYLNRHDAMQAATSAAHAASLTGYVPTF